MPVWLAHLPLAWPLAKRDVLARYRGSVLGLGWALLLPLFMVGLYTLVFEGVFKARWTNESGAASVQGLGYSARLFAGLIVFSSFAEVCTRATRLIADNANLVKRVVFPLELLVIALLLQVAVHSLLQMAVLALLLLLWGEGARLSWLWLPLAFAWLLVLQFSAAMIVSALAAYVRDLQHVVPVLMTVLMFVSPLFYPVSAAPPALAVLLALNPLTVPLELMRAAWFGPGVPALNLGPHVLGLAGALAVAVWLFGRLRSGFADLV